MSPVAGESPGVLAARAIDRAPSDPTAAVADAERALELAAADGRDGRADTAASAVAWRALGLVALYGNDLGLAAERLRRAVAVAETNGHRRLEGEARMSLAPVLYLQGNGAGALAECERAAGVLTGLPRARLDAQWAGLLLYLGRPDEALVVYARALPRLRRAGDRVWEARARHNRGLLYMARGDQARARADLVASEELFAAVGMERQRVAAAEHLGRVEAAAGDLPAALESFARVDEALARLGERDPHGLIDRSAVLLSARLGEEAADAARRALVELASSGDSFNLAHAHLALAEAVLLTGETTTSAGEAEAAAKAFVRNRSPQWAALARFVAVRARWLGGERSSRLLTAGRASGRELERGGWTDVAGEARLLAGQLAVELGHRRVARVELARAARRRRASPAPSRVRAWHATARLRLLDGDRGGARSAVVAGLRVVDTHRATLGATELRARATGLGADLALLGLRLAIEDGSPAGVLRWSERWRAGSLTLVALPTVRDPATTRDLSELRSLTGEIASATASGDDVEPLRRRQLTLERAVNRRVRTMRGVATRQAVRPPSGKELAAALGEGSLVEIVEVDGDLHAVVVDASERRRPMLVPLSRAVRVLAELDAARFALRRLAFGRGSTAALAAAGAALAESAKALDDALVGPWQASCGTGPLVLVPTGALHALPWSILPTLAGRPVTVAPSAALWLRAATARAARVGGVALVAGPRLPGAAPEIRALARRYPDARRLAGRAATADAVAAALDGARLAHVAAHGRFRGDNPLFSCLELADGPLTVHDLESLDRPPEVLVLSACDSGLSTVHPGDELLGLAASLLGLGTRTIIASLLPVPDDATRRLMIGVHGRLRQGHPPAAALAGAQAEAVASGDRSDVAAAASFVCLGAG